MRFDLITHKSELDRLESDWARLLAEDSSRPPGMDASMSLAWHRALIDSYLPQGGWRIVVACDEDGVAGILPLYDSAAADPAGRHDAMAQLGQIHSGRSGFLVRGGRSETLREMLSFVDREFRDWATLDVRVVEGGRSDRMLREALRDTSVAPFSWETSPYVELPEDLQDFVAGLKAGVRTELRRRERRLREAGDLQLKIYDRPETVQDFWSAALDIERNSWKEREGTSITAIPRQQHFYEVLLPKVARSGLLLSGLLCLDGRPIAHRLSIASGDVALALKTSYREDCKAHSPATVMQWLYMQEIHRRGLRVFDLTGTSDEHKLRWTERTYTQTSYRIFRRSLAGTVARIRFAAGVRLRGRGSGE